MKKYSWLIMLVFVIVLVACVVLASKNEAVRDTFMKAADGFFGYTRQLLGGADVIPAANFKA